MSFEKEEWDSVASERLQSACNPAATADLAAIVMQARIGRGRACILSDPIRSDPIGSGHRFAGPHRPRPSARTAACVGG